jgi:hypothetical protein
MANAYISFTHGGLTKRYVVQQTLYEPHEDRSRRVFVTVGKKTRVQDFGFIDKVWIFNLLVPYSDQVVGGATYGGLGWLKDTLYAQPTVAFTDHYDIAHTVVFEGEMVSKPLGGAIDGSAKFVVQVRLRKHQP